ncbi:glycosyltransferase [Paraflavitalea sp. CAU 1676]|uniref:polysaccharide deacetylase family protein n=1 Tax=Paraflavitalea sp. CAU 1676 TaxID=3032598 RepID=UPI0023D9B613|nr:glycosyltransferase [Paraflavitalea sp. CAU 1676]MDF2190672.1 glycosyltransferase [Paraflavitalea sp. CAU 1676]
MGAQHQIFQTDSKWRWRTFQWTGRSLFFLLILTVPVVIITLNKALKPGLPALASSTDALHELPHPITPAGLNKQEARKYKGFEAFLQARERNNELLHHTPHLTSHQVRAAFYVDWDPQSFYSLQQHIDKLNMVVPEWFFIDPATDTLRVEIDQEALQVMKQKQVKIVPLINNTNEQLGEGGFDGAMLHRILHNPLKRERLINDIVKYLDQYQLQGINIDFEEFREKGDEPIIAFQRELYNKLHPKGYLVTQDIMPHDADFNVGELQRYNDYMFLMAYDEHFASSVPGSVSSQQWIEKVLDETAKEIPTDKLILCIAGYGYDWAGHMEATTVTYQQALANARQYNADIDFDNDTYNNHYQYTDGNGRGHDVYFNDAASNFNTVRFADEYGTAGTALWRLGSEDERLWTFYNRNLTNKAIAAHPFDYNKLMTVNTPVERPDYIGDGEVLNVITAPQPGKIDIMVDSTEGLIGEQRYVQLPTKYVIRKYGVVHKQVALTFDDGPDPTYTPQVLDILKKENVPAAFFVIGLQAENNLPLLKRIYREGHEIGNHTFTHPNIAMVSPERAATEMEATRLLIESITGHTTVLFRAPYNADSEPTTDVELRPINLSKQQNYYTVGESIDPNDWEKGVTADSIYARTIREYEANPEKGIILLHDAGGNRAATVAALPGIIHYFKERGIGFTTISGLLGKTKDEVMPPVNNSLVAWNGRIATVGYWLGQFLSAAFWVAILLGFIRIGSMAIMALMQKIIAGRRMAATLIPADAWPAVSIIVPAYNEEINAVKTIENLLQQDYPAFDIIFVDDGSKDATYQRVQAAFAGDDRVKVLTKPNGGKASALNFGIAHTQHDFVVCIDADTQLKQHAVRMLMTKFIAEPSTNSSDVAMVGAVAGNVKVGNERNMLTRWQSIEYTTAQNFDRRAFDLVNGITVVPGAIGAFRKAAIEAADGFTSDTLAEDCDLTIRILRNGYQIVNCPDAIAVTEAPETLKQFMKQRFRWTYGIMQSFWKNRDACFNPRYKALGMVSLPNILLFQIILPALAPLADVMFVLSLIWNRHDPESMHKILVYYLVFFAVDILVSIVAFAFEKEKPGKLVWLIPQRLVYRQLMYVILFKALRKAVKGEGQGWGVLKRTGNVSFVKIKYQNT